MIRDLVIANIFSAEVLDNDDTDVLINYTIPKYRDFKVGIYFFEKKRFFDQQESKENYLPRSIQ